MSCKSGQCGHNGLKLGVSCTLFQSPLRARSGHSLRAARRSAVRDKTDLGRNRRYDRFRPKAAAGRCVRCRAAAFALRPFVHSAAFSRGERPTCGTKPPDARAAKLASVGRLGRRTCRGIAARFLQSGRSKWADMPKSKPTVRCARLGCLSCGLSSPREPKPSERSWHRSCSIGTRGIT